MWVCLVYLRRCLYWVNGVYRVSSRSRCLGHRCLHRSLPHRLIIVQQHTLNVVGLGALGERGSRISRIHTGSGIIRPTTSH